MRVLNILFNKETGQRRCELVERVIRFETKLYRAELVPARLLAATLIMSNKLIDKKRLEQLWEVIKMLDRIEIARKKGIEEGKKQGINQGIQDMILEALIGRPHIERRGAEIAEGLRDKPARLAMALFQTDFPTDSETVFILPAS